LDEGVSVGPYTVIGAGVEIGAGTQIGSHVVIQGPSRFGRDNQIFQFASLGAAPQDKKYRNEPTRLEVGDRNVIREYCTFNRGTVQGGGVTRIGDDNWIMAYVHIAHDCLVANHTVFANGATLAGHVSVADHAILGGFTLVHQFCRLGAHCFAALATVIKADVPPYVTVSGNFGRPHGINAEGLRRRGYTPAQLMEIRRAYKTLYRSQLRLEEALAQLAEQALDAPEVGLLVDFIQQAQRGIVR
jgi:UDP-N-acetylglucosamine acyltransferase